MTAIKSFELEVNVESSKIPSTFREIIQDTLVLKSNTAISHNKLGLSELPNPCKSYSEENFTTLSFYFSFLSL